MNWLLGLAILLQTLDSVSTCQNLSRGYKEANRVLGNSCSSVVLIKSIGLTTAYTLAWKRRNIVSTLAIVQGGVGFTVNVTFR